MRAQAHRAEAGTQGEGVFVLVRETADGLGELVGQHFKLARLELAADMESLGTRARELAVLAALVLVGYTLAMVGLASLIGGMSRVGWALVAVGLVHVAGGAAGLYRAVASSRGTKILDATAGEMSRSVATLGEAAAPAPTAAGGGEHVDVR
jgi:hypothetical protein